MSAYIPLEAALNEFILTIQPSRDDFIMRRNVLHDLQIVVRSLPSLRGATIEPFGSFVSDLFSRSGDLDISLEFPSHLYISTVTKKYKITLLRDLKKALIRAGGWRILELISQARIPILKLERKYLNISCDISINNQKGIFKSKFLLWISGIDKRFHDMVLLVKKWAKAHAINEPKDGSLNSYSFVLLVIFHFQTCEPAILPPLKQIFPDNIAAEIAAVKDNVETKIKETCDQNIAEFRSNRLKNRSSLSELFISFFAKFSDIGINDQCICPFTGTRENWTMKWFGKPGAIIIEDPFEAVENCARSVGYGSVPMIRRAFTTTHHKLVSASRYQNHDSIIAYLFTPQAHNMESQFQNLSFA